MSAFYGNITETASRRDTGEVCCEERGFQNTHRFQMDGDGLTMTIHLVEDTKKAQVCDGVFTSPGNGAVLLCTGYFYSVESCPVAELPPESLPLGDWILERYRIEGMKWLRRVEGQFAFVLWDRQTKTVYLGVDPVNAYLLYYTQIGRELHFATTMEQLLRIPGIGKHVNIHAMRQMITFCSIAAPETAVDGIFCVPAGTYIQWTGSEANVRVWWDLHFSKDGMNGLDREAEQEWIGKFQRVWGQTLREMIPSVREAQFLLSGGLDSSAVAASARALYPDSDLRSFSLDYQFAGLSERKYQDSMAGKINSLHECKNFTLEDFLDGFSRAAVEVEGPFCELGTCAYSKMYQILGKEGGELYSGLGVDELYAGYITYKADRFRGLGLPLMPRDRELNRWLWGDETFSYENFSYADELQSQKALFSESARESLENNRERLRPFLNFGVLVEELSIMNRRSYVDFRLRLVNHKNFQIAAKLCRRHGIRTHYPFLNRTMLGFAESLPSRMRLKGNTDKYVIRKAMKGIIPEIILSRKKITLADFSYREILQALSRRYRKYFSPQYIKEVGIFSEEYLTQLRDGLAEPKSALETFREKNILLSYVSLSCFIDHFGLTR